MGAWTEGALFVADHFKLCRTDRCDLESGVARRLDKGEQFIVTEDDVWTYLKGIL